MNLKDLEYLVAVGETLHFGQAAQRCFVSQPTLSGQINKLEQELGVMLFERTNRSVHITPMGETMIEHARKILEQADVMRSLAKAQHDPLAGPLRIGAIHTLSPYLVPLFMLELQRQHPELLLELTESTTEQLLLKIRAHQIDGALLATAPPGDGLKQIKLFKEPFWLAHPRDHHLYEKDEITAVNMRNQQHNNKLTIMASIEQDKVEQELKNNEGSMKLIGEAHLEIVKAQLEVWVDEEKEKIRKDVQKRMEKLD